MDVARGRDGAVGPRGGRVLLRLRGGAGPRRSNRLAAVVGLGGPRGSLQSRARLAPRVSNATARASARRVSKKIHAISLRRQWRALGPTALPLRVLCLLVAGRRDGESLTESFPAWYCVRYLCTHLVCGTPGTPGTPACPAPSWAGTHMLAHDPNAGAFPSSSYFYIHHLCIFFIFHAFSWPPAAPCPRVCPAAPPARLSSPPGPLGPAPRAGPGRTLPARAARPSPTDGRSTLRRGVTRLRRRGARDGDGER